MNIAPKAYAPFWAHPLPHTQGKHIAFLSTDRTQDDCLDSSHWH